MRRSGFTLIELLVVVTIMVLIFGSGVAAYRTLDRRQSLANVCRQIEQMTRTAQRKARVGEKPTGCVTLTSYRVSRTNSSPDVIKIQGVCSNRLYDVEEYDVPTLYPVQSFPQMDFKVLHGGVEFAGGSRSGSVIAQTKNSPGYRCQFDIESGGSISATILTVY